MKLTSLALHLIALSVTTVGFAKIIGTNPPALPLTQERIATLPKDEQPAWRDYLERSVRLRAADQTSFAAEIKTRENTEISLPPKGHDAHSVSLDRRASWYGSADARHIADNVISYQTPAGGWSKNFNPTAHTRQPGEAYSHDNTSPFLGKDDNDQPAQPHWSYIGTFDNDATITELRFIAKVAAAASTETRTRYATAFHRGLEYIFNAQYPNGGWPQVYPLDGGYHDAITFNDGAMIHVLSLLRDVAAGETDFKFVTADDRDRAAQSAKRGIACVLASQIKVDGHLTAWCQQHDLLTLVPTSARNYEMPSLASGESAGILMFLMELPKPNSDIKDAVRGAAAWFKKTALYNKKFKPAPDGTGRQLQTAPGEGPIWSRYAEIGTNRPLFGDRDKSIHDEVDEISQERRNGYAWFGDNPKRVLDHFAKWTKTH